MADSDLTVEVFQVLRNVFFDKSARPIEFALRPKQNTQDDPLDEYIYHAIRVGLPNATCEKSSGPLISPDMIVYRENKCNGASAKALMNDTSMIVGIEAKKLERTPAGDVGRSTGLDYNTTPPCGNVIVYDRTNKEIIVRGFYLFLCLEPVQRAGTYKITALVLCDGNALNADFDFYKSIVGIRKKEIMLGSYGDGANRVRPMLIFPNPLGAEQFDHHITLIHSDENLVSRYPFLTKVHTLQRSYAGKAAKFSCYRFNMDVEKGWKIADLVNPFPTSERDTATQQRGRFMLPIDIS